MGSGQVEFNPPEVGAVIGGVWFRTQDRYRWSLVQDRYRCSSSRTGIGGVGPGQA